MAVRGPADLVGGSYYFLRLHADLETSALLAIAILSVTADPNRGAEDDWLLATAESLRRQGVANLSHRAVEDRSIVSLVFKTAQWTGSIQGHEAEGVIHAARVRDEVILLIAGDMKSHVAATLPIMQASMKTFVFHGDGQGHDPLTPKNVICNDPPNLSGGYPQLARISLPVTNVSSVPMPTPHRSSAGRPVFPS